MFPPPRSRLKSGETRTPATGKDSGTDNREGRADRRLCSGVKGPPRRGSLAPRLHAAGNQRAPGAATARAPPRPRLQAREPGGNREGIRRPGDGGVGGLRRRRLPGPLPARDSCRRPHGAPRGSPRGPCATRVAAGAVGSRDPAAAPVRAARASGHRRRERGAHVGPRPTPGGRGRPGGGGGGTAAKLTPTSQAARARRGSRPRRPAPREAGPPGRGAAEGLSPRALAKMPP